MTSRELLRALRRFARAHGIAIRVKKCASTGHHRRIILDGREATVIWSNTDLTEGVVRQVLQHLEVTEVENNKTRISKTRIRVRSKKPLL